MIKLVVTLVGTNGRQTVSPISAVSSLSSPGEPESGMAALSQHVVGPTDLK